MANAGDVLDWLLDPSEPAMRYLVSRDLLSPRPGDRALGRLRADVAKGSWAAKIFTRQKAKTYWATKKACYIPKFTATIWQLQVLADLGLSRRDERIANAVELWFDLHRAKDGGYTPWSRRERAQYARTHFRHPDRFMKNGHLCTTGNMVRSLIRFGYLRDERVRSAIDWLVAEQLGDGGWDCFGRPAGTIDAWEAMSAFAEIPSDGRAPDVKRAIERGAEFFLKRRLVHEGGFFEPWWRLRYPWQLLLRRPRGPRLHVCPRIREGFAVARGARPRRTKASRGRAMESRRDEREPRNRVQGEALQDDYIPRPARPEACGTIGRGD